MDDWAWYQATPGLSAPWQVEQVALRMEPGEVEVWVAATGARPFGCPVWSPPGPSHDHVGRRWRQLDAYQFRTLLWARVPRFGCATHVVRTARFPWVEPGSRISLGGTAG